MPNKSLNLIASNPLYASIAFIFFGFSLIEATWIIYIPHIFEKLSLTHGILGIALLCKAIGAFTAMPLSASTISKYGEGNVTFVCLLGVLTLGIITILSPTLIILCLSLFVFGFFAGMLDIAMNAIVSFHEKNDSVMIMGSSHGFWSLGGMIGAGIGTWIATRWEAPAIHMSVLAAILLICFILISKYYKPIKGEYNKEKTKLSFKSMAVFSAALIALIVMMSEGMIADWSSLYLKEAIKDNFSYIGLGYAGFSMAMALGRFSSDSISENIGGRKMISIGLLLAFFGCLLILTRISYICIIGFFFIGIGLSGIIPEMFRIAANFKGIEPAKGMAVIAGTGYFGFLLGPVIFGGIAEFSSLFFSFVVLCGFLLVALFTSRLLDAGKA